MKNVLALGGILVLSKIILPPESKEITKERDEWAKQVVKSDKNGILDKPALGNLIFW